jgi:hypothetical protein
MHFPQDQAPGLDCITPLAPLILAKGTNLASNVLSRLRIAGMPEIDVQVAALSIRKTLLSKSPTTAIVT